MSRKKHRKSRNKATLLFILVAIAVILFFSNKERNTSSLTEDLKELDTVAPEITLTKGDRVIIAKRREICSKCNRNR